MARIEVDEKFIAEYEAMAAELRRIAKKVDGANAPGMNNSREAIAMNIPLTPQVSPPAPDTESVGQYQEDVKKMVTQNAVGWGAVLARGMT